jgi:hypothetical protein
VPYSFESFFLYSGLSTRFEVAESHTVPFGGDDMRGRGSCIFRCWLLSRDAFAPSPILADASKRRVWLSIRFRVGAVLRRHLHGAAPTGFFGWARQLGSIVLRRFHLAGRVIGRCGRLVMRSSFDDPTSKWSAFWAITPRDESPAPMRSSGDEIFNSRSHLAMKSSCDDLTRDERHLAM